MVWQHETDTTSHWRSDAVLTPKTKRYLQRAMPDCGKKARQVSSIIPVVQRFNALVRFRRTRISSRSSGHVTSALPTMIWLRTQGECGGAFRLWPRQRKVLPLLPLEISWCFRHHNCVKVTTRSVKAVRSRSSICTLVHSKDNDIVDPLRAHFGSGTLGLIKEIEDHRDTTA